MKVLYLSVLASSEAIHEAEVLDRTFCAYAVQKFHRLLTQGLVNNGVAVNALSTFYLPKVGKGYSRQTEYCDGVSYDYIPTLNNSLLRHLWLAVYCFVRVFFFGINNRHDKALFCDVLNISACMGAVAAARLIGLRCVGIVTDMPEFVVGDNSQSKQVKNNNSFAASLNMKIINGFSHYVFLTEQMSQAINVKNRPYVVMEGMVDSSFVVKANTEANSKRIVMYAGGIDEKYGLRLLVEGFLNANVENSELHIYGDGPFVPEIIEYTCLNANVMYKGIQPNEVIVEKEQSVTLLVNPRPTNEEFTKYSFPSKNMEYMISGTPLLTTRLPGMPDEYYPHVFLFDDESVEGYTRTIHDVLTMPIYELQKRGRDAQHWVMENKNNRVQAKRILDIL